ncbi:MAG: FG-GAP repeat protein, partial [Candidatus Poribacteria bacterium]|nr:FG-GAP repeat protein [Candidatus Poribacteria bacterium]
MNKSILFQFAALVFGVSIVALCYAGGDKLVGMEEGVDNKRLAADVSGNTLAIGASGGGFVKIYSSASGNWKETWQLTAQERVENVEARIPAFGWAVSLTGVHEIAPANYAIVGAPTDTHPEKGEVVNEGGGIAGIFAAGEKGAAYIFRRTGNDWRQQVKLVADDPMDDDRFGESVAIFRTSAIVGVSKDDDNKKNEGSAYLYVREGEDWRLQTKIVADDLGGSDAFGESVDIRERTAVIGAPGHTPGGVRFAGAAYIYVREGDTWRQQAKLVANDGAKADRFGSSVAIGSGTVVIGAPSHDTTAGKDAGAVYV